MGRECTMHVTDAHEALVRKSEGKRHKADLGMDGLILLIWILKKKNGRVWTLTQAREHGRLL
jgi:hypothetical protein